MDIGFFAVLKNFLFGSVNNFFLKSPAEVHEAIAVTCDPNDKVSIFFGFFHGVVKSGGVDDIELDMMAVHFEIGSHQM